jgi:hypothetical protein
LDVLKRLAEIIPFLEPYPTWTKAVVGGWIIFSAFLILALLFAPRRSQTIEPLRITGLVISAAGVPVQAAAIEFAVRGVTSATITDSEGRFRIETTRPATTTDGRIRISASGYRSYDRVLEIRSDSRDLGSFTLRSDSSSRTEDSDRPSVPLPRRQQPGLGESAPAVDPIGEPPNIAGPRSPVSPGVHNLDFSELTDADGTPFRPLI